MVHFILKVWMHVWHSVCLLSFVASTQREDRTSTFKHYCPWSELFSQNFMINLQMTKLLDDAIIFPYFSSSKNIIAEASNFHSSLRFVQAKVPFFCFLFASSGERKKTFQLESIFILFMMHFSGFSPKQRKKLCLTCGAQKSCIVKNRKTISQKRKTFSASGRTRTGNL